MGLTTDNDASLTNITSTTDHLVTFLKNAGISWMGYMESMPTGVCPLTSSGDLADRASPFSDGAALTLDWLTRNFRGTSTRKFPE